MADSDVKKESLSRQPSSPGKHKTDESTILLSKTSTVGVTSSQTGSTTTQSTANKTLQSHIAAALKMSTTSTSGGGVTPLIVGLISSPNKPHGQGGVVVTKTVTTPTPTKTSPTEHLSGSQVVKISAAANPNTSGALATKLKSGVTTTPSKTATVSSGSVLTGKPKSFMTMLAGGVSGAAVAGNTGGGSGTASGKKQTTKRAQPAKSGVTAKSSKIKSSPATTASAEGGVTNPAHMSRVSQRSIKRPHSYDEEVEFESPPTGRTATKKTKLSHKTPKGAQKNAHRPLGAVKDLGRWRPTDDLMLISAVQQTNDLSAVHLGVKFSCRFTLREVEERWYALLYDPQISKIALEAMRALHPGVVTMALNNALWSQEEEAVLAHISSTDPGHLETFQSLLKDNPTVFHTCRTATSLHHHWVLMGHYCLLNNQKVDLIPPSGSISKMDDAEDKINDSELAKPRDVKEEALEQELVAADRLAKREIMKLEDELPSWRTVIDASSVPDVAPGEYAVLKGRVVEFTMTKRSVTLGRATPTNKVDFDLSLEGPSFKISRKQATLHLTEDGELFLTNDGRRPLYVDGKALLSGKSTKITNNQLLEVASISFLILVNSNLPTDNS